MFFQIVTQLQTAGNLILTKGLPHFGFQNKCGGDLHFKLMFVSFYEIK